MIEYDSYSIYPVYSLNYVFNSKFNRLKNLPPHSTDDLTKIITKLSLPVFKISIPSSTLLVSPLLSKSPNFADQKIIDQFYVPLFQNSSK